MPKSYGLSKTVLIGDPEARTKPVFLNPLPGGEGVIQVPLRILLRIRLRMRGHLKTGCVMGWKTCFNNVLDLSMKYYKL